MLIDRDIEIKRNQFQLKEEIDELKRLKNGECSTRLKTVLANL